MTGDSRSGTGSRRQPAACGGAVDVDAGRLHRRPSLAGPAAGVGRALRAQAARAGGEGQRAGVALEKRRPLEGEHPAVKARRRRLALHEQRALVAPQQRRASLRAPASAAGTGRPLAVAAAAEAALLAHPGRRDHGGRVQPRRAREAELERGDSQALERVQRRRRRARRVPRRDHQARVFVGVPFAQRHGRDDGEAVRDQPVPRPRPRVGAALVGVHQHVQVEEGRLGRPATGPVGPEVVDDDEAAGRNGGGRGVQQPARLRLARRRARCWRARSRPSPRRRPAARAEPR